MKEKFISPIKGKVIELSEIEDQVFGSGMMGKGFAIVPESGDVYAPVSGTIAALFPTKHAVGIKSDDGLEVLIHFGMDTVTLNGEGFKSFVKQGDKVKTGDKLLSIDLESVRTKVPSIETPIVFPEFQGEIKILKDSVDALEDNFVELS